MNINQKLKQFNIEIPENLKTDVTIQLNELGAKSMKKSNINTRMLALVCSIILIFFVSIFTTPIFANISEIFNNLTIGRGGVDFGVVDVIESGYPSTACILKDGDYTLIVDDLIIDETQINFLAKLESNKISKDKYYIANWYIKEKDGTRYQSMGLVYDGLEGAKCFPFEDGSEWCLAFDDLLKFNGGLPFYVELYEFDTKPNRETIEKAEELAKHLHTTKPNKELSFKIPFYEENIQYSKEYTLDNTLEFKEGTITLEKLIVYPTKAELYVSTVLEEGYDSLKLDYCTIVDKKTGNKMRLGSRLFTENKNISFYTLTPSLYLDIDEAELQFVGFEYGYSYVDTEYIINKADIPFTIPYEDASCTIVDLEENVEKGEVALTTEIDVKDKFHLESLDIVNPQSKMTRLEYLEKYHLAVPTKIRNTFEVEEIGEPYTITLGDEYIIKPHDVLIDLDVNEEK